MAADNPGANKPTDFQPVQVPQGDIGNVQPTDSRALYAEANDDGVYTDYHTTHRYETDNHRYMAGITRANGFKGGKAAFFQLAAPTTLLIVDWTLERRADAGDYPIWPTSDPQDGNTILLDKILEPAMLGLGSDGVTVIYRLSGTYVYGFLSTDLITYYHGRPPWMDQFVVSEVYTSKQKPKIITN